MLMLAVSMFDNVVTLWTDRTFVTLKLVLFLVTIK